MLSKKESAMTLPKYIAPIGTQAERESGKIWPGAWFDATGFAVYYSAAAGAAYHTGADLNLNSPSFNADAHSPVYAIADGLVTCSQVFPVWGHIIVIWHDDIFARYAHVEKPLVKVGDTVKQGQQIASVGNANGQQPWHLHFDISPTTILREKPAHWPKMNITELKNNYVDPKQFLINAWQEAGATPLTVWTTERLNVRSLPTTASRVLRVLDKGAAIKVLDQDVNWYKLAGETAYIFKAYTRTTAPTPPTTPLPPKWQPTITPTMRGVHASAGGWAPSQNELDLIHRNNVKWVLIPTYEAGQGRALVQYRGVGVEQFVFRAAIHDPIGGMGSVNFLARTTPILDEYAAMLGTTQNMMIAIHNEPNLFQEGAGIWWQNGAEFAIWWQGIAAEFKRRYPGCKVGFPAMSPGGAITGVRLDEAKFINAATSAINVADWIGVHYYWQKQDGRDIAPPVNQWRKWFGSKPILGTEVGPVNSLQITSEAVARSYSVFASQGISIASWLLSGAGAWQNAEWVSHGILA